MKLTIAQVAPARVALPVRLHIRPDDLPTYQAATLSHRTFVDATIDLGAEDFNDDAARLAARDLASLLHSETRGDHDAIYHQIGVSVLAGMLVIEVAYPFDEADIRRSVIGLVADAVRQQGFVQSTGAAFDAWAPQATAVVKSAAKALQEKLANLLSEFDSLQLRRKAAIQQLNRNALLSVLDDYRELASQFPCVEDIESALSSSLPLEDIPFQVNYLSVKVYSDRVMQVFQTDLSSNTTRTLDPHPSVSVTLAVLRDPDLGGTTLNIALAIRGSLIRRKNTEAQVKFPDLDPLLDAIYQIGTDWAKFGRTINEQRVPEDISDALLRIETRIVAAEADAWIKAHGSPSLQLGHEQNFSMTRQYRLERAQSVLSDVLTPYPGWALVLASDFMQGIRAAQKASPSARALDVLVGIRNSFAPEATILYAAALNEETVPEYGEYVWIPDDQCFPESPGIAICWPLAATTEKSNIRRR